MKKSSLSKDLLLKIHKLMVKARVMEERLIHIHKQGLGHFWIGGPGEEAFAVPLGLLIDKGQGLDKDWLYLHYRCLPTLAAMGLTMKEAFRTMLNKAADESSGGRNFANHYCLPRWNVAPVSSVIEVQYAMALGTARAQKKAKNNTNLTVVTGGDAGSHEGDFASCLIWASRPVEPLPLLITAQNNSWGISTPYEGQHASPSIAKRAEAFGIESFVINGNDPIESWSVLSSAMQTVRKKRKPVFIEARVSRLYGHSSATGANYVKEELCCIKEFEIFLQKEGLLSERQIKDLWGHFRGEAKQQQREAMEEPEPSPESIWRHIYYKEGRQTADWRYF